MHIVAECCGTWCVDRSKQKQWRSQDLPGWASHPPGRPNWGSKWKKIEEKCEKIEENEEKLRKCSYLAHPGVRGWLRSWAKGMSNTVWNRGDMGVNYSTLSTFSCRPTSWCTSFWLYKPTTNISVFQSYSCHIMMTMETHTWYASLNALVHMYKKCYFFTLRVSLHLFQKYTCIYKYKADVFVLCLPCHHN